MKSQPTPAEMLDPSRHAVLPRDAELFRRQVGSFVPPGAFDVHAYLYPLPMMGSPCVAVGEVGIAAYSAGMRAWMGDRAPVDGLFFAMPGAPQLDAAAANRVVAAEVAARSGSRALMLVGPQDDPAEVDRVLQACGYAGFKPYHTFAACDDTMEATIDEYLPEWAWELADARGLVIMLHLVRSRALADEANQQSLRRQLARRRGAKLILAHAGRGFCAQHTLDGIDAVAGFDNVYFDTSAICESPALVAVLRAAGASRLMFGSDFPVCQFRGRVVSVADGFAWMLEPNVAWSEAGREAPTLVGVESLLALKQAALLAGLGDGEVEAIFCRNARDLLGVGAATAPRRLPAG